MNGPQHSKISANQSVEEEHDFTQMQDVTNQASRRTIEPLTDRVVDETSRAHTPIRSQQTSRNSRSASRIASN